MPKGSGRRPKPTALRKLEGNRGKRALNSKEPMPELGEPEMPDRLAPLAQQEWRRIVPELLALGVLSKLDQKALAGYCSAYARHCQAEDDVAKYGLTIEEPVIDTKTGKQRKIRGRLLVRLKANPAAAKSSDAAKLMKSFLIEFGLTPASRSRLSTNPNGDKAAADPADKYFGGGEAGTGSGNSVQ